MVPLQTVISAISHTREEPLTGFHSVLGLDVHARSVVGFAINLEKAKREKKSFTYDSASSFKWKSNCVNQRANMKLINERQKRILI